MKSIIFVSLLVAAIAIPLAEAQIQIVGLLPLQISVSGIVFCSANASVPGTLLPFSNATVQLQCGGGVVSTNTTIGTGDFLIVLNNININLDRVISLLNGTCEVVVTTPLANCNVTLGSLPGLLRSNLQLASLNSIPGLPSIPVLPGFPVSLVLPRALNLVIASLALRI